MGGGNGIRTHPLWADMSHCEWSLPLLVALGDLEHLKVHCHRAVMETILRQVHNTAHSHETSHEYAVVPMEGL